MRDIKFRAWDTVTNKYFWPWPEGFSLFGEVTCFDCMGQQLSEAGRNRILGLNDLIIEQYTGLKDKNGREIYEGDIVRLDSWKPSDMQIAFIEGAFCLADKEGEFVGDIHYIHHAGREQSEILGNIHENPELLA